MLTAVDLDHELARRAGEIGDEPADRVLPAESPWHPALAQRAPQQLLGVGRIAPETAGYDGSRAQRHRLHALPLPREE